MFGAPNSSSLTEKFARAGLDGPATLGDLARLEARLAWLYDEWARIDAWLDEVAA